MRLRPEDARLFDKAIDGYVSGCWTCDHILHAEHGVTHGRHPQLEPCPWCEIERLMREVKLLQEALERANTVIFNRMSR